MSKKFIDIEIKGMKKLERKLKKLEKDVKEAAKPKKISVTILLSNEFIRKHTRYASFTDFVIGSGIISEEDDISENILFSEEFNNYVKNTTRFSSWKSMLQEATLEHYQKQLGFK